MRVLGGPTDPDSDPDFNPSAYQFGGADELLKPDTKPVYGGKNDPGRPVYGGKNDPGRPVYGGKGDPENRPKLGGRGDPDHRRGSDPRKQSSKDSTREDLPEEIRKNECDEEVQFNFVKFKFNKGVILMMSSLSLLTVSKEAIDFSSKQSSRMS